MKTGMFKSSRASMKKEISSDNKNLIRRFLPEITVLLFCILILTGFISQKEGYHMDELLSFELANAEFTPWIVPIQPMGRLEKFVVNEIRGENTKETIGNILSTVSDVLSNGSTSVLLSYKADVYDEPVWITAGEFKDYITVGDGDGFNLLSVYFNVKDDNHPPVHFALVHLLSSVFRGKISPFIGCSINLAAVMMTLVLLMWLGRLFDECFGIENGRLLGIFAALSYGLSSGAIATTLLIRMYGLLTFFCVAFFWIHVKKWCGEGFDKHNKLLILITVLGFLTQYFFLFYCLILAASTSVWLLVWKRYRELFVYIRSMIIAAVIGLACFPFAISDVFASGRGIEALGSLAQGMSGYGGRIVDFFRIVSDRTFGIAAFSLIIMMLVVLIVIRPVVDDRRRAAALFSGLLLPQAVYFFLVARMAPYRVDRYVMPLFPFVIFTAVFLIFFALKNQKKLSVALAVLLSAAVLFELPAYDNTYLYKGYSAQEELSERYSQYPCICVYAGVGYYENLIEFTNYNRTLLVNEDELEKRVDTGSVSELDSVVVLVKPFVNYDNVCDIMKQKYGFVEAGELLKDGVHGDIIVLFENEK